MTRYHEDVTYNLIIYMYTQISNVYVTPRRGAAYKTGILRLYYYVSKAVGRRRCGHEPLTAVRREARRVVSWWWQYFYVLVLLSMCV